MATPEEVLPLPAVAKRFNVSSRTIKNWIKDQGFPKPHYIGKTPFFRGFEVAVWQEKQRQNIEPPPKETKKGRQV